MNLFFDTNIILALVRDKSGHNVMEYLNPKEDAIYVSFVNIAEAQSIAFQNKWGFAKVQILEDFFQSVRIIGISDLLLPTYIGIDAYSQRNHPDYEKYPFSTPRNMGKNDLLTVRRSDCCNCFSFKPQTYYYRWRFRPFRFLFSFASKGITSRTPFFVKGKIRNSQIQHKS